MGIVAVTGGRNFRDYEKIENTLNHLHLGLSITLLVHGGCSGADLLSETWAHKNGIHTARVNALWENYGKAAGPKRNEVMLSELNVKLLVAFPGGKGTDSCCRIAKSLGIYVLKVNPNDF